MNVSSDQIGSADAAKILGLSIPRVQALKARLGGVKVGGSLIFSRSAVLAFKKVKRKPGWKKGKPRESGE